MTTTLTEDHFNTFMAAFYACEDGFTSSLKAGLNAVLATPPAPAAAPQAGEPSIWIDAGHLREVLNGNDMPAYCQSEPGDRLVPLWLASPSRAVSAEPVAPHASDCAMHCSDDPKPCDCRLDTSDAAMLDWLKAHTNVAKAWTGNHTPPFTVYWGDKQIRHAVRLAMYAEQAALAQPQPGTGSGS